MWQKIALTLMSVVVVIAMLVLTKTWGNSEDLATLKQSSIDVTRRLDSLDSRLSKIDERLERMEAKIDSNQQALLRAIEKR